MHDLKNNNIECGIISLTDTDGTEFYTHDASHRSTLLDIVCSITFMMPNKVSVYLFGALLYNKFVVQMLLKPLWLRAM